ncbi:MAG: pitrilysin family protein [Bacteroidota bacterium]
MRILSISLFLLLLFSQCSPKTGETVSKTQDKAEEVVKTIDNSFRTNAPTPGPAPIIRMGTYENFKLDNGLQVILVENHKLPRVSFRLFVDVPPLLEKEAVGYVSIAGELLNKGTTSRTKAEIDEAIDFIGASLSTSASGMNGACLTKHTDKLLDLMSDILLNPSFSEKEFDKIKKQNLSALAQGKDDPGSIAANVADVLRYGKGHPYGELTTENTLEKVTLEQCRNYYKQYFQPQISYLVVVGDIEPATVKEKLEKAFGQWKKTGEVAKVSFPQPIAPEETQLDFVNKTGAVQSVIAVTYPVDMKPGAKDVIPARVLNTLLGSYFQSRLNQNLRETNGYTYGARSRLSSDPEIGYFTAGASVRNEVTDSSIVQFLYELDRVRKEPIPTDELDMVKNVIAGGFARSLEQPQTVARFALNTFRYNLPKDYYTNYLDRLSKVTAADVQLMAQKYIRPDKAHILVVGNKEEVVDKLTPFAAQGKVNYYDVYGNELDMSATIPDDLTADDVIENYINAVGGMDKLKSVKDINQRFEASLQGMSIVSNIQLKAPNKMSATQEVNGTVMEKRVFDGQKGMVKDMTGKRILEEGNELALMKNNARIFGELDYKDREVKAELKGIEVINGRKAYKVVLAPAVGGGTTDYFDIQTGYKIRQEILTSPDAGPQIIDLQDYKEVDGIQFPHQMTISGGGMPFTLRLKAAEIKVNGGLEDALFQIGS